MATNSYAPLIGAAAGGGIVGGTAGLITSLLTQGGGDEYKQALQIIQAVQDPQFDFSSISPAQLSLVAKYSPETYSAVVPQDIKLANDSPELRQAEAYGLSQWKQISQEGLPQSERLAAQGGQDSVRRAYRQALDASIRNMQERGQSGGGAESALRSTAGQEAANMARDQGNSLAQMAVQNRLTGLQQMGNVASGMRAQDINLSQGQAQDYNRMQEYISGLQTNAALANAASRQQASNSNVAQAQQLANFNATNKQQTQEGNVNRINDLRAKLAQFRLQKAGAAAGAMGNLGYYQDTEKAGKVNAAAGLGGGVGSLAGLGIL